MTEILRLSNAFIQDPPYNELGFRHRPFRVCFPDENSFIGWVRYDDITPEAENALREKYQEFFNQNQNNQQQNNQQQNNQAPQQGGKRKRRRNKTRRNKTRRNKTRRNKTRRRR